MMARLQKDAAELAALPTLDPQQQQPPLQPPPQPPPPAEGAEGADAVPPGVARQLSAMQHALEQQEQEARRMEEQLVRLRGGRRDEAEPLGASWRQGGEEGRQSLDSERERQEKELARVRFEREMLEEKARPARLPWPCPSCPRPQPPSHLGCTIPPP